MAIFHPRKLIPVTATAHLVRWAVTLSVDIIITLCTETPDYMQMQMLYLTGG